MSSTSTLAMQHAEAPERTLETATQERPRPGRYTLQLVLFFATFLTTTLIGMRYAFDFSTGVSPLTSPTDLLPYEWALENLHLFAGGLPFSFTLIAILLAHEFGHYAACRAFKVDATWPYLFPAPTLSGTFGAVIRIRSKIKSRAALILIGASGPIAGFCVAIVTTCYGLSHSRALESDSPASIIRIGAPALIVLLRNLIAASDPATPELLHMVPHPVLIASWIGLIITSINLIPAGQLDGGHILYALSPRAHKIASHVVIAGLIYLGTVEWMGWLFWAFLLMLPVMRHPRVFDDEPLSAGFIALAPVSLFIFLLTASTQPSAGMSLMQVFQGIHWGLWLR